MDDVVTVPFDWRSRDARTSTVVCDPSTRLRPLNWAAPTTVLI